MYAKYLNKMWTYIIFSRYLRSFDVFIWPWLINGEVILDFPYLLFWSAETMKDSYNHNCSFLRKQPRCRRGPGRLETTEKEFEGLSHVYPKKKSWNLTFLACLSCPVYLVNFLIPSELSLSSYDEVTTHLSELFWRIERKLETSTGRLQKSANGSFRRGGGGGGGGLRFWLCMKYCKWFCPRRVGKVLCNSVLMIICLLFLRGFGEG